MNIDHLRKSEDVALAEPPTEETVPLSPLAEDAPETSSDVILPFEAYEEYYIEDLGEIPAKPVYTFFKRVFDIVVSLMATIILAIPMAIVAIIIKCSSSGPVFYKQERLGRNGVKFNIVKYRTMYIDAEKNGAQWANGDADTRIVPCLRWIRKFRIDELPQFLCGCLTGQMSIVGPRPERECFYDAFEVYIHGFRQRLKVKPGLTGLAQISGGYELKPEEKILYDIEYIKKRSLWLDFVIVLKTFRLIVTGKGSK